MNVNQPMNENIISPMFFIRNIIVNNPAHEIIPEKNKITQEDFSFLLYMKSERYMTTIPFEIRKIPNKIFKSKNKWAISGLNFEKNPHSCEMAVKLFFMLNLIKETK